MLFRRADGAVMGSIVNWADHPETPWADNTEITADFPGFLREALENGITVDGTQVAPGLGGMHVYVNGAIGGLMTTNPATAVEDPYDGRTYASRHTTSRALSDGALLRRCSRSCAAAH